MQLRVFAHYTTAELAAMSDEEWLTALAHLAAVRQAQKRETLNAEIELENMKRESGSM